MSDFSDELDRLVNLRDRGHLTAEEFEEQRRRLLDQSRDEGHRSQPSKRPPTPDFSIGEVLGTSLSVWFKNLIPFTILGVIIYSPLIALTLVWVTGEITLSKLETLNRLGLIIIGAGLMLDMILSGALTYGVVQQIRGRHASMGQCLGVGLARALPVLGVAILAGLIIVLGMVLCIVPGVIAACVLWVAVPVAVIERPGVIASLNRSRDLTHGYKALIFVIFLLLGVAGQGIGYVLQKVFFDPPSVDKLSVYFIALLALTIITGTVRAVTAAVAYARLRNIKEDIDIDALADVFA